MNFDDSVIIKLLRYCHENDWTGSDPYDALNSRIFEVTPFRHSQICRLAFIQIIKRLPFNIRPLLLIKNEQNPKAIALFLMGCLKLANHGFLDQEDCIRAMVDNLVQLRSKHTSYWCWGYSFPWQTRTILVAKGAPNLVCTVFVANALLDAYEAGGDEHCLVMANSAAEYILDDLYWTEGESVAGFCYPIPELRSRVHNAHFLGAALFCRIYNHTGQKKYLEPALKVARYSAGKQNKDGSWDYGESSKQGWVDNFHTGYNLCALRSIGQNAKTLEFESHVRRGFNFYRKHFFREDNAPKYFHNRTYPIDVHSVAQSIITLLELKDLDESCTDQAHGVYRWAINQMFDDRGYFYYQIQPFYTNRISYMRWSQAWMLLALARLREDRTSENIVSDSEILAKHVGVSG